MGCPRGPLAGVFFWALGSESSAHCSLAVYSGVGKRAFLPQMKPQLLRFQIFDGGKQGRGQRWASRETAPRLRRGTRLEALETGDGAVVGAAQTGGRPARFTKEDRRRSWGSCRVPGVLPNPVSFHLHEAPGKKMPWSLVWLTRGQRPGDCGLACSPTVRRCWS